MMSGERKRAISEIMSRSLWRPLNPPPKILSAKDVAKLNKREDEEKFKFNSLEAFEEIVRMAEAGGNLVLGTTKYTLGRYIPPRWPHRR
jgi:hypothetical protein